MLGALKHNKAYCIAQANQYIASQKYKSQHFGVHKNTGEKNNYRHHRTKRIGLEKAIVFKRKIAHSANHETGQNKSQRQAESWQV